MARTRPLIPLRKHCIIVTDITMLTICLIGVIAILASVLAANLLFDSPYFNRHEDD
jgi:hypothetical protein